MNIGDNVQIKIRESLEKGFIEIPKTWIDCKKIKPYDTGEWVKSFTKEIKKQKEALRFDESFFPKYVFELGYSSQKTREKGWISMNPIKRLELLEGNRRKINEAYASLVPKTPFYMSYWINESEVGLPHEVHFKENKNRTTLVWKNGENYSTTVSEAHEEKFDRLFGFLMAYFKRIYKHESKTWRKKYLNKNVYSLKQKDQVDFLKMVFAQNCGLKAENVYEYLENIVKNKGK